MSTHTKRLIERTEGNPFFLEESVRALVETGVLVGARGAYRLAKPLDSPQVPATVHAVLAAPGGGGLSAGGGAMRDFHDAYGLAEKVA